MGAKGKTERPSERKAEANRQNARKPRGRWANTPEREALDAAKAALRASLPGGAERLAEMIENPDTPPELFLQAYKLAADKAGLPSLSSSDMTVTTERDSLPLTMIVMGEGVMGEPPARIEPPAARATAEALPRRAPDPARAEVQPTAPEPERPIRRDGMRPEVAAWLRAEDVEND